MSQSYTKYFLPKEFFAPIRLLHRCYILSPEHVVPSLCLGGHRKPVKFKSSLFFHKNLGTCEAEVVKNFAEKSDSYIRRYAKNVGFSIFGDFPGLSGFTGWFRNL